MRFLIVVEKAKSGYSAYSPDLSRCVAAGSTRQRVVSRMHSAIRFHLEGLRMEGQRAPAPKSYSTYIEIPA